MSARPSSAAAISTSIMTRVIVALIALWSFVAGSVLVGFQGAASGALGAGVNDPAGQRLAGAHLLVLVPVYLLIAWRLDRYHGLVWLPFAAQVAVATAVVYSVIDGATRLQDGILAVVISTILAALLAFVWVTEQRAVAGEPLEYPDDEDDEPPQPT